MEENGRREGGGKKKGMEWVADGEKEGKREKDREGGCRTKDKECGTQGVTRISFDGITWRLRTGTVIALVVYR